MARCWRVCSQNTLETILIYFMAKQSLRFHITLLSFLIIRCSEGSNVGNSLNDDLLLPYPLSQGHGPQHHNRYVRDCQPVIHGNVTYETWTSDKTADFPVATTRVFVSKFPVAGGTLKSVYGHVTVVRNPLKTVSVLEPGGPQGCTKYRTATVEETAKPRKCLVAQNGGYFNTQIKQCLGNIVSDGNLVQNSKGIQNAQFGIKKDGTLVFGYLSEDDVLDEKNPFVQLVSGVVWLLRNGNIYINESKAAECEKTQETGTFDKFVNVVSARTAVGHDNKGQLILIHFDGQTGDRGMNLWEMATFLKSLGVVNAVNLDGGGSATPVLNGCLASYPSDHWTAWIIITAILGLLLLTSTTGNVIRIYGRCRHDSDSSHSLNNYSCHPLNEVNGKLNCAEIPEPTSMEWTNGSIQEQNYSESIDFS